MRRKYGICIAAILAMILLVTACGGASTGNYAAAESSAAYAPASYEEKEAYAEEAEYEADEAVSTAGGFSLNDAVPEPVEELADGDGDNETPDPPTQLSADKLVYTCNLSVETTEYKKSVEAIRAKIREYGAIIEYENETDNDRNWYYSGHVKNSGTMYLSMRIRVPSAKYESFVNEAGSFGKITSKSQNVENISRQYHSTQARIEALEKEQTRLYEMMDAAETIEEMIYIEERLTDVEAELNTNKTNLASMDVDVAYSTVNLDVREVLVYSADPVPTVTFGERVKKAFSESWEGFADFLEGVVIVFIHLLPFILLALVIVGVVIFLRRLNEKKHPERKAMREQKKEFRRRQKEAAKQNKIRRGGFPQREVQNAPNTQNVPNTQPPETDK